MGFVKAALDKDKYNFISLKQIVLYVQSLDSDKPSLADTAKFLLRCYDTNDAPLTHVDSKIYHQNITNNYIEVDENRAFCNFLEFVAAFNDFECGTTESSYYQFKQLTNLFLPIHAVQDFLIIECELEQPHDLVGFIAKLDKPTTITTHESNNFGTPSIQMTAPNPQNHAAKIAELQAEITHLKSKLAETKGNQEKQNSQARRAENKQAEIIAALAVMYTKTDCSKPYEAAETIRQEWQRQVDKLGNPPASDTLAKYIKHGIERLS